jgi:hypothetical protein
MRDPAVKQKRDVKRGVGQVFHLGCWRTYSKLPFVTRDTRGEEAKKWIQSNRGMFWRLNNLFYNEFPELFQTYMAVNIPVRMFGAWAAIAINGDLREGSGIELHRDAHDFKDGFCFVVPFGNLTDGNLRFPKLKMELEYGSKDVVAFQSLQLHEVLPFHGQRYSLVLFSHNNLFYDCRTK